jgi:hypothetical protein
VSDDIEDREVHLCRVGTAELLKVLKTAHAKKIPQPIRQVAAKLKVVETEQ